MPSDPIVILDHVTKEYWRGHENSNARLALPGRFGLRSMRDSFKALDDVSFEVMPGEAVALIGDNGAGKSTTLKIIAGAVSPSKGYVRRPVRAVSIIELGLGFDPDLSGVENLTYGGAMLGMSPREVASKRDEIIDFAELEGFESMPVKRYSTGMLARLGFALATSLEAELFVIDEVLSVGDWGFQKKSLQRIRHLNEQGASLIFVSHSHWIVHQLCDRAILLDSGRVVSDGAAASVLGSYLGNVQYILSESGVMEVGILDSDPGHDTTFGSEESELVEPNGAVAAVSSLTDSPGSVAMVFSTQSAANELASTVENGRAAVTIRSLDATPTELESGEAVTLTAVIEVHSSGHDLTLVSAMYWQGYAAFAAPDLHPSEFLGEAGVYEVRIRYSTVTMAPSVITWTLAVIDDRAAADDVEQLFPQAVARADVLVRVTGPITSRPGVKLPHEFALTRMEEDIECPCSEHGERDWVIPAAKYCTSKRGVV